MRARMKAKAPVETDLVLIGGGHAHVQVLKAFGMEPEPGVRLTLVARELEAPYSGMLPAHIAGHYDHDAIHIDMVRMARFADARIVHADAIGIDAAAKRVLLDGRPPLAYDLLSIDIGITPQTSDIRDDARRAIPVKPVSSFAPRWREVEDRALRSRGPRRFAVVGGGAAGLELVLAIAHRLRTRAAASGVDPAEFSFTLISGTELLPSHPPRARTLARAALVKRDVALIERAPVTEIAADACVLADGRRIANDAVLVTTKAAAASWLAACGLPTVQGGFLALRSTLQVEEHDDIFAAGDCATVREHPRPKAGVFAVRQGPPLTANLRRCARGEPALPFTPQKQFLTILSLGDKEAVASRDGWAVGGRWVWSWKDRIDRDFMAMFQEFPAMASGVGDAADDMRCAGCAAKVGPRPLADALDRLATLDAPGMASASGAAARDDAAVIDDGGPELRLESVDYFRAFWPDPYVQGAIAANHALNDILAMGGKADRALAICTLPHAGARATSEDLFQLLAGARGVLDAHGVRLVGGHSSEGPEFAVGFSISGTVARDRLLRKGGMQPGDALILTKPLGTGLVLAAEMRLRAKAPDVAAALAEMRRSNAAAASVLAAFGARAMTDVSGFGLIGHLLEMATASGVTAVIDRAAVPLLPGAMELAREGVASTLLPANAVALAAVADTPPLGDAWRAVLLDPQTAGGLLVALPAPEAEAALGELLAGPAPHAAIIGHVAGAAPGPARITVR